MLTTHNVRFTVETVSRRRNVERDHTREFAVTAPEAEWHREVNDELIAIVQHYQSRGYIVTFYDWEIV